MPRSESVSSTGIETRKRLEVVSPAIPARALRIRDRRWSRVKNSSSTDQSGDGGRNHAHSPARSGLRLASRKPGLLCVPARCGLTDFL